MTYKPDSLIPVSAPSITALEVEHVTDAIKSGWVSSLGPYLTEFENRFAGLCNTKHAITVSNGTVGIHLVLVAHNIGPHDEVIIPDLTFVATANAVKHVGATPVFVDIEESSLGMCPEAFERAITSRTKAVMPVHLYGHPANMGEIDRIAAKHGIIVIEDAAEAHGAMIQGRPVGGLGQCGVFSFYGNKILTTGEGGAITTNDEAFAERLRFLRDHAMSKETRYWHTEVGYNYRLTNLQAALGVAQMKRYEELTKSRQRILDEYRAGLGKIRGIRLNPQTAGYDCAIWMICLENEAWTDRSQRASFMTALRERQIDSRPYFYRISDMPPYQQPKRRHETNISEKMSIRGMNLPTFPDLSSDQIRYVCDNVKQLLER